jgi:hypothetical protein
MADILGSRCRPISGYVGSVISESGVFENGGSRWKRVEIYFGSKVIFTSGFGGSQFESEMSADVGPCRQCHI